MVFDCLIVGGGAVGLATGLQLLKKDPRLKVMVVEKEDAIALHQTGNNSGVIHSGLYYKPGSLKALNCLRGYDMLVAFCREQEIPFELCGKLIVATSPKEEPGLHQLFTRGQQNGLSGLKLLKAEEIPEYEPHVRAVAGMFVPQTGIVDYKTVAQRYAQVFQQLGGTVRLGEKVTGLRASGAIFTVVTQLDRYQTKSIVNCAGLYADKVTQLMIPDLNIRIIPFRGEYYKLRKEKEHLVRNLIYPVPDPNFPFLGVHFTRMARGGVEAGPNAVLAFAREGYRKSDIRLGELAESLEWPGFRKVAWKYWRTGLGEMYRSFSKAAFTRALQKMIPELQERDLVEGGAGVRAQACDRTGGLLDDFVIREERRAIHICNAPSPAATSSLSIGETVAEMVVKQLK